MLRMQYCYLDSPIGRLLIAGDGGSVRRIAFPERGRARAPEPGWTESSGGALGAAVRQLREYFAGRRRDFDLPLAPEGTEFQRRVWERLRSIPYGQTISYAELARRAGNPKAARAAGSANGSNRIPIVIPCHRVIAADGSLGGFGGGLEIKRRLLDLESRGNRTLAAG
jgi:methylated-DNA-[protein]-cysteine S-methyltransferase